MAFIAVKSAVKDSFVRKGCRNEAKEVYMSNR